MWSIWVRPQADSGSGGKELCPFSSSFGNMRSRSSSLEDILQAKPEQQQQQPETRKRSAERGEPSGRAERRGRHREPPGDTGTVQRNHRTPKNTGGTENWTGNGTKNGTGNASAGGAAKAGRKEKGRDLSRDDLIFLLSLLEGELQVPEPKRW